MGQLLLARLLIADDPAGAFLRAAGNTLLNAAALSVLAGFACAMVAVGTIYLGSTRTRPKISPGRVWAEWKRRKFLWALSALGGAAGAVLAADALCRELAAKDLYWITRAPELFRICWLGGVTGYLFGLLIPVTVAVALRRRARRARPR